MKLRILTLTLILILTGCAPALSTPEPNPDIMPRLDPSPTPSGSTLPQTCQVTDLTVYINEANGYCFAYPARFSIRDPQSNMPDIHGPNYGSDVEPVRATFGVEITIATANKSLREQAEAFLKEFSVLDPSTFTWTEIRVGGEPAWAVEPIPVQLAWQIVFVQHNGKLFRLMYWPIDIQETRTDIDEITQTTLGSFAFIK
jgi:hypothetical protein